MKKHVHFFGGCLTKHLEQLLILRGGYVMLPELCGVLLVTYLTEENQFLVPEVEGL